MVAILLQWTEAVGLKERGYLESQLPTMMGYFQLIMGYFRVLWPIVLGYLAFQLHV